MAEKFLSPKKIQQDYGIDSKTVYWWVRNGDIIFFKNAKKILIPKSHFEKFLENHLIDKRGLELS